MRIEIVVTEAIDGHRLDILEDGKWHRENPETALQTLNIIFNWVKRELRKEETRLRGGSMEVL